MKLVCYVIIVYSVRLGWNTDHGGMTSYIAKGEDEEVTPAIIEY